MDLPITSLEPLAKSVRRVRATERGDAFREMLTAMRGTEESVKAVQDQLAREAGTKPPGRRSIDDLLPPPTPKEGA